MNDPDIHMASRQEAAKQALMLLELQAARLLNASTNGSLKPTAGDSEYRRSHRQLQELLGLLKVPNPIPYTNLSEWNGRWKRSDLPKWHHRRKFVEDLVAPTTLTLETIKASSSLSTTGGTVDPTWRDLEVRIEGLAERLERARSNDDRQDVGRRAREILIDAAVLIQDPTLVRNGDDAPKAADAKQWLGLYLERYAPGSSRTKLRRFVTATWDLAQRVTHSEIDHVESYAAAEATVTVVRVLQLLEDQREGIE